MHGTSMHSFDWSPIRMLYYWNSGWFVFVCGVSVSNSIILLQLLVSKAFMYSVYFLYCRVISVWFVCECLYFSCHKTESSFDRKCLLNLFQLVECFIRSVVIINVSSCMVLNWLFINRILIGSIGLCSYYLFAFGLVALKIAFW